MLIEWPRNFSTDITSIDVGRPRLVEQVAGFVDKVRQGLSPEAAGSLFGDAMLTIEQYFIGEETVLRNIGLPNLEQHREKHQRLLIDMGAYRETVADRQRRGTIGEIANYFTHWLWDHAENDDSQIRTHLWSYAAIDTVKPAAGADSTHAIRQTILIVDDEPSNIHVLAQILKPHYEIVFALSGADAIRIAKARAPDLILLDAMMPGMDGFAVCALLKTDPILKDSPVIFVTAMNESGDETRGLEAGAIDYITKPVNPAVVRTRVRNHLELKAQRDLLRSIAFMDGLTAIASRRRFDEAFAMEWRRAQRTQVPLSLIMGDIDYFKAYNDHYGHPAGDACLKAVAATFQRQINRPGDLAARYGGEEMVCLLPNTSLEGACEVARRIQVDLTAQAIPHAASPVASFVTLSLGVATAIPGGDGDKTKLLALADHHLYAAKRAGRNTFRAEEASVLGADADEEFQENPNRFGDSVSGTRR
jgi:diguanylate cyclase (GGDEF)-like protein/hemerythrin-like metal-binding protein